MPKDQMTPSMLELGIESFYSGGILGIDMKTREVEHRLSIPKDQMTPSMLELGIESYNSGGILLGIDGVHKRETSMHLGH
jgi:hypothetical protein